MSKISEEKAYHVTPSPLKSTDLCSLQFSYKDLRHYIIHTTYTKISF